MNADSYELGVRNEQTGTTRRYESLAPSEIARRVQWLKAENRAGHHVYIRPSDGRGLILVDDISEQRIGEMAAAGLNPALTVLTSPGNYQAWVRLSLEEIPSEIATQAAKILCQKFGGDPGSAEGRHFGRLAGFTNVKPKYVDARGYYPFVKVSGSRSGGVARAGAEILSEAYAALKAPQKPAIEFNNSFMPNLGSGQKDAARAEYSRQMAVLENRYGSAIDYSRADWMIVRSMMKLEFTVECIEYAMENVSPELIARKGKHAAGYVKMTIQNVADNLGI